jgi:HSP20 family protein
MAADLIETDTDFHIHADLPGVENLDISVKDGHLLMKAERKITHEVDTDLVHSVERSYGKVQRQILLPENADGDKAFAKYKNGVLTVSIPKKAAGPAARKLIVN